MRISPRTWLRTAASAAVILLMGVTVKPSPVAHRLPSSSPATAPTDMPEWAASPKQVANALCSRKAPFSEAELRDWIASRVAASAAREDRDIHGISFRGESPELLDQFERLTTPPAGSKLSVPSFTSSCTDVVCAAQEIFGAKQGLQLLMLMGRYGFNGSHLVVEKSAAWTADELDDVLLAHSDYPESMASSGIPRGTVTHGPRKDLVDDTFTAAFTNAKGNMRLYNWWSTLGSSAKRRQAVFHEIGHLYGFTPHDPSHWVSRTQAWSDLSGGWNRYQSQTNDIGDIVKDAANDPTAFVSTYGRMNIEEDFAEAAVAYRYNPASLQKASSSKYEFMKEYVFDGLEYTADSLCSETSSQSRKVQDQLLRSSDASADSEAGAHAQKACGGLIIEILRSAPVTSHFGGAVRECLRSEVLSRKLEPVLAGLGFRFPEYVRIALSLQQLDTALPAEKVDAVADSAMSALKSALLQALLIQDSSIKRPRKARPWDRIADSMPEPIHCADWNRLGGATLKILVDQFGEMDHHREALGKFFSTVCSETFGSAAITTLMNESQAKQAIARYFSDSSPISALDAQVSPAISPDVAAATGAQATGVPAAEPSVVNRAPLIIEPIEADGTGISAKPSRLDAATEKAGELAGSFWKWMKSLATDVSERIRDR